MKKIITTFLIIAFIIFLIWMFEKFIIGVEDKWVCVGENWVKRGKPAAPRPKTGCGSESFEGISKDKKGNEETDKKEKNNKKDINYNIGETSRTRIGENSIEGINNGTKDTAVAPAFLNSEAINKTIKTAVKWIKKSQEPNGHFRYEYSPVSGTYSKSDLMARQSGALYVLGEVLKRDGANKYNLKDIVEKAIGYFKENSVAGEMNGYKFRCVLRTMSLCSLGATSLTLVGTLDLVEKHPELEDKYKNLIADYLNYILAMKKTGKGFRGFYYLNGNQSEGESDFSNGEAFLALVRYYEHNPVKEIKMMIDEAFDYFESHYSENWNYNFYLWGMAAVKGLYKIEPLEKYYNFAKEYTDWRVSGYKNKRNSSGNKCAYIEGVISAYSVLEPNLATDGEKKFYLEEIDFWLAKSKELQVGENGIINLKLGREIYQFKALEPEKAAGGFLTSLKPDKLFQRIDFTQHCLSSYLQKQTDIDGVKL
jgi:hypothetical protein